MSNNQPGSCPILTIAVPTFNRVSTLRETLTPLLDSGLLSREFQLCVFDNASDDGTSQWLDSIGSKLGCSVVRQPLNLGLEGNIIDAMLRSRGEFVWTLSDHMVLRLGRIKKLVESLPQLMSEGVDVIYAGIEAYGPVLGERRSPYTWKHLSAANQSRIIFRTGNTSGMITRRRLRIASARSLYRFARFSYPHLGVFAHIQPDTVLAEFDSLSEFATTAASQAKLPAYNSFKSRFIGYPDALGEIRRLNANVVADGAGLSLAVGALRQDLVELLQSDVPVTQYPLATPLRRFPWRVTPLIVWAMAMQVLPVAIRRWINRQVFRSASKRSSPAGIGARSALRINE